MMIIRNGEWTTEGITYISYDTDGLEKIFIIQPDGTGRKKLLDESIRQGRAPWNNGVGGISWNNEKILFTSYDSMGNEKIFEVDIHGKEKRQVIQDEFRQWDPDWSPDANYIVYVSYDSKYNQQLFIVNANGKNKTQIFDTIRKSDPNWGKRGILFVSYENTSSSNEKIFFINPDGTGKKLILEGYRQKNPRWSPDGNKILYEEIALNGDKIFKIVDLSTPSIIPTTVITPTPMLLTQHPLNEVQEEEKNDILLRVFLVLGVIVILIIGIIIISDIISKRS